MRLLVSVASAAEADAARRGGADVIDAKDPLSGPIGAVSLEAFAGIRAVAGDVPVSAALGDHADPDALAHMARQFVAAGATFVKAGFAGVESPARIEALLRSARAAVSGRPVIAVAYADHRSNQSASPFVVADVAARCHVGGVLIDTADKDGPSLFDVLDAPFLRTWIGTCRRSNLVVAVAGRLAPNDLPTASRLGADIAGVRGAACDGGRAGRVSEARVRALKGYLRTLDASSACSRPGWSAITTTVSSVVPAARSK